MALKDLKSDLSKFRRPIEKPLVDKKRVDIPKSTNQQPLSQFVDKTPSAPKSNTTTPKQGVTPNKFDNSSKFLGETNPNKFDNSSKFLGEVDPNKFDNSSNFLGEINPNKFDNSSKFLGETTPKGFDNSSKFLGETDPNKMSLASKFLGETDPNKMSLASKFLGETTPSPFDNSSNFLGETNPNKFDNSSNFLGETTPNGFDNSSNFLGETTPNKFDNSSNFLGETTPNGFDNSSNFLGETNPNAFSFNPNLESQGKDPRFVDFITNDDALGFSPFQKHKSPSKFTGVDQTQRDFDGTTSLYGFTTPIKYSNQSELINLNSAYDDYNTPSNGISFTIGYKEFKVGSPTPNVQRYNFDKIYEDSYQSIGGLMEQRNSPSFLDRMYAKFNLKDDSPNFLNLVNAPYILTGIQRKKISKGEPQFWDFGLGVDDGLIRGGIVASTTRALVDVLRIGSFFLSVKGLLWGVKQIGMQRTQKYGKTWTPINLLANIAGQHLGLKFDRPGILPIGDETFKYKNPLTGDYRTNLERLFKTDFLDPNLIPIGIPIPTLTDENGGFDSIYGIGLTTTTRGVNTFDNPEKDFANKKAQFSQTYGVFGFDADAETGEPFNTYKDDTPISDDEALNFGVAKQTQENSEIPIDSANAGNPTFGVAPSSLERKKNLLKSEGFNSEKLTIADYEAISYGTIAKLADNPKNIENYKGDFRNLRESKQNIDSKRTAGEDYDNYNRQSFYGTPSTFKTNAERIDPTNKSLRIDSVYESVFNAKLQQDFVHLFFAYDTNAGTQDNSKIIQFRSTISGVTETFSPSWNGIKYPGRADKAYMYSEFERTLSFTFKAYASSRDEMKNMWSKLSELSKLTMPTYGGGVYSGHICYFRLGQLWGNGTSGVPSLITSLTYTIPDDLSWDLNHDGELAELPLGIDVSIGLTILPDTIYKSSRNHYSFYDTKAFQ